MNKERIPAGSLVLYKMRPAVVQSVGRKKLEIEREGGVTVSVRYKDVELLHPGPLESLDDLEPPPGEVEVAWELLAGGTTTLRGLAELAYAEYTPASAWAAWELVEDGLYFEGTPEEVIAHSAEEVAEEREARAAKAAAERAWNAFLERLAAGRYEPEDEELLREVEEVALGRYEQSRVLRELGRTESPENAHALLLEVGYWDETVNPYPVRLGLPTEAPEASLPELADEERVDLTHLAALAIDDAGSRDPDDAVSLEMEDGQPARLWVHVADVAALAPPDSAADVSARGRGASLYLPEGTVPMLPSEATLRLGLGLAEVSPALSFGLDLDESGDVKEVTIVRSRVRVTRLSYAEAEERLEEEPLRGLYHVARKLEALREQNGALAIELPEVKVRVVKGRVTIRPLPALRSRMLVREAMLAAGEGAARFAVRNDISIPFSTQEPPEEVSLPTKGPAGQFALRRAFRRSQATTTASPHAGLGLTMYAQATSPLRRYADLVVHQQLRAFLCGGRLLDEQTIMERVGAAEAVRDDVRYAERLANEHWTLVYLLQNPDWQGEGIVVEQYGQRSKLLIPELAYETQLYLRRQLPLDSKVMLAVNEVNLAERTAHFREL